MPAIHSPAALVALRLGARTRDLLNGPLEFVVERARLVADDDLLTVLRAVARAHPDVVDDIARRMPDSLGELVDRAITTSDLPRPLALARVKAGLYVGPGADRADPMAPNTNALGTPRGLILPPAVRRRLAVRLVCIDATLAVSEGALFAEVPVRTVEEFWAIYPAAEMPRRDEVDAIEDEVFGADDVDDQAPDAQAFL